MTFLKRLLPFAIGVGVGYLFGSGKSKDIFAWGKKIINDRKGGSSENV